MSASVLLIDDEEALRDAARRILAKAGYRVSASASASEGIASLNEEAPAVAIIDLALPDMDGVELLARLRELRPGMEVIVLTGRASVEAAVDAMRLGAYDFIEKPIDRSILLKAVGNAVEKHKLARENRQLRQQLRETGGDAELIGDSPSMAAIRKLVHQIARTDVRVLIQGESGTGKELVADLLHAGSDRRERRIVKISCAAIPEDLLESELFGFERGAFTGANVAKPGKFEIADGGTLFLDEIAEMSTRLQAKLLRVLQDGIFQRLGSTRDIQIDVRVVSATHVDLGQAITEKTFREDLYYRLNVAQIVVPPLRNRREDLPLLAAAFLRRFAGAMQRDVRSISEEAMAQLSRYSWPGNVRELQNAIQRAVALAEGPVIRDFPMLARGDRANATQAEDGSRLSFPIGTPLSEIEEKAILATLEFCGGNKERAARTLGVSARTLYRFFEREAR